jgi:RNA polymerase sigma factor (sigma-70 family)
MEYDTRKGKITAFLSHERERLIGFVRRIIDDTAERDAEDIVQDVILNIFNRADITIPIDNLAAYVYRSLRNRVIDYLRKRRDMSDILPDPRYDPDRGEIGMDIRRRLFQSLAELSEEQRAVIIATELEGRTFQELSDEWAVPLGTLLARKSRALRKMRKAFSDMDE